MADPRYVLDTGPLVAFANAADLHHRWAVEVLDSLGEAPATTEVVLAEACHLLASSRRAVDLVLALPAAGQVRVEPILNADAPAVRVAMGKYWPMMDLADGCVLQLAARYPRAQIVTTDLRDFRIYRHPNGQPLALIHPAA